MKRMPVPANLVPPGERAVDRIAARGVQTYECRAKPGDPANAAWVYVAANVDLLDGQGQRTGGHRAPPPVWEASDGSRFVGEVKARADAPVPGAAQWLLLTTRSTGTAGRFSAVTSLQRVNTAGGVAPPRGCDAKTIGVREQVPFTAEYVLFTK